MEQFRAPAVPLATVDPFFSVWSNCDALYDGVTRHWTGRRQHLCATVMIDGKLYSVMGKLQPDSLYYQTEFPPLPQTSVEIFPLTTVYTFENDAVRLTLRFMTPLLPDDLELLSRPISYICYELISLDGASHAVRLMLDVGGELAASEPDQGVVLGKTPYSITAGMGKEKMFARAADDQRIEWGTLHLIAPDFVCAPYTSRGRSTMIHKLGYGDRKASTGNTIAYFTPQDKTKGVPVEYGSYQGIGDRIPVLCADREIELRDRADGFVCIGYDDEKSIQYFGQNIEAYWRKNGATFEEIVHKAIDDYPAIVKRVHAFDADLCERAAALHPKYRDIVALAYRQSVAAHKLTYFDGELQFISKENGSNGCAATVDVTYPSIPLFLIYNPKLVEGMLNPIFKLVDMGLWPYDFAPHDAGRYPLLNGQVYGYNKPAKNPLDYQMPVEECGNMLLCVAALCRAEKSTAYFEKHFDVLKQWADWLAGYGYDPDNQLCTDDFAGHLAHNCNLSVKGIMGLAAFAALCEEIRKDGAPYRDKAKAFAASWMAAADDGDHYRLAFDRPDSWSIKYNLIWDKLLGLDIFPAEVAEKEVAYYKTKLNSYGLPLDNRADYTKSDWQMWSAVLTDDKQFFGEICERMWAFLNETPDRVPFTDWYFTSHPHHRGFQARSVQGGLFIPLLKFEK